MKELKDYVTSIPDFPEKGIMFRDVTTVLQDADGFQMAVDEVKSDMNNDDGRPKTNVIFRTTQGTTTNMVYPHGTIMDKALEQYLSRVGRPDLYRDKSNQICFLYNGSQIKFGEKAKVEIYFKNVNMPKIIVNDVHNLIGA